MESISAQSIFRKSYKTDILALSIKKVKKKNIVKVLLRFITETQVRGKIKEKRWLFI